VRRGEEKMRIKPGITKMLACLGVLTGCVGVSSLGVAADNCSGTWVQVGTAIVTLNDDHSAPDHMAVGVCGTTTLRCTYKDKDGDTWTDEKSLGASGTWKNVSGTGKYANTKSSGWSKIIKAEFGRPEGTIYIGVWGGECSM
jgi:hypothetical protein